MCCSGFSQGCFIIPPLVGSADKVNVSSSFASTHQRLFKSHKISIIKLRNKCLCVAESSNKEATVVGKTRNDLSSHFTHGKISVSTEEPYGVYDITPEIREWVKQNKIRNGIMTVTSLHTTCGITVNENEQFLKSDIRSIFMDLVPSADISARGVKPEENGSVIPERWLHNKLNRRPATERDRAAIVANLKYTGYSTVKEFMDSEPQNAHAHICSMLIGNSTQFSVVDGNLNLGIWQSILFVDFDGPRNRSVQLAAVHVS